MAKYCLKKKSRRETCRKRYKIEKKVKEHHRKLRKVAKKSDKSVGSKKKQSGFIQVPSKCPFKEEILLEAQQKREETELKAEQSREEAKERRQEKKAAKKRDTTDADLSALVDDARKRRLSHEQKTADDEADDDGSKTAHTADGGLRAFAAAVRRVVADADVIIEVLDARDPLGSRCGQLEKLVIGGGKRLVLLLNKIDLVPKENVEAWLKYLRNELPAIPFKASTQQQKTHLGRASATLNASNTSKCVGAELVMKLLGNYCRSRDIKMSIRVGVVGYPNVGKSSVINSLHRKCACNVGAVPGITRALQEVELDQRIKLIDSPGVVFASKSATDEAEIALRNAVRVESLQDPVAPVEAILRRCSKDSLRLKYGVDDFGDAQEFLALAARRMGRLRKGARPDVRAAAKQVLNDWNTGRLRYFTQPPAERCAALCLDARLVDEMAAEFDVDNVADDQRLVIHAAEADGMAPGESMVYERPQYAVPEVALAESADAEMVVVRRRRLSAWALEAAVSDAAVTRSKAPSPVRDVSDATEMAIEGNQQVNRKRLKATKRLKKRQQKLAKTADRIADSLQSKVDLATGGDSYDFAEHFE